jgi:H+/Cl- antiporter ClcA
MQSKNKHNTFNVLFHWHSFRFKLVLEGIGVGILAGFITVLYRYILQNLDVGINNIYRVIHQNIILILPWTILLVLIGIVVGIMVKKGPIISGSGIPQVEGVLLRKLEMNWWKVIIGKFVGGILAIGTGLSLGREGPSVQIGAAVGQGFAKVFKRVKIEEKYLITSGASAGLAAAFNAPLAGAMFALEEVHKNFSPLVLLSGLSAALSSDFIASSFFGLKPILNLKNLEVIPLQLYGFVVVLGIIIGVAGVVFNEVLLKTQNLYAKQKWLPKEMRIIIPLIISVFLGIFLPQALGGGNDLITSMLTKNYAITILLVLVVFRFFFTMICYGSGAPGGIFLPLLAIGALIGNVYGVTVGHIFNLNSVYVNNFIILAMAGYFTAIVRAPITGIILITEMTGSFNHLLSLSVISIVAYLVADILNSEPIYEALLEKYLKNQGEEVTIGNNRTKTILEFAVCLGSTIDGKKIKEVKWPSNCLLVSVRRGEN